MSVARLLQASLLAARSAGQLDCQDATVSGGSCYARGSRPASSLVAAKLVAVSRAARLAGIVALAGREPAWQEFLYNSEPIGFSPFPFTEGME